MNPSFFSSRNSPYYLYTPDYVQTAAGIRCMHYLCHALNELGEEAYIAPARVFNPKLRTPALTTEIALNHYQTGRTPIAVYPEVIPGNPFGTPVVSRWLLNKPGHLGGDSQFHPNDLIFYIQKWCLPEGMLGEMLTLPTVDQSIFNNINNPHDNKRSGACYYAHKYLAFGGAIDPALKRDAISLCLDIPRTPYELADILRRSEVLYCHEQSSMILEALACGCPVLIVPSEYWDLHGSDDRSPKGAVRLASEPNALSKARKHLADFYTLNNDSLKLSWRHVRRFIENTQFASIEWREKQSEAKTTPFAAPTLHAFWSLRNEQRSEALADFKALLPRLLTNARPITDLSAVADFSHWLIERTASLSESIRDTPDPEETLAPDDIPTNALLPDEEIDLCADLRDLVIAERTAEALILMEKLTERGSTRWEIYNDLGGHYAEQGRLPEAAITLERGANLETGSTHCLRKLAAVYAMQEDFGRILATCAMILKREPDDQELHLFVRDVLVASSPSLKNLSWLDSGGQVLHEKLKASRQRERETRELLDEIRHRASELLNLNEQSNTAITQATSAPDESEYEAWVAGRQLQHADVQYFQEHVRTLWKKHPLFEFIVILRPGQEAFLADTIDSLSAQYFDGWRLSIFAQTPSPDPEFRSDKSSVRWIEANDGDALAEAINHKGLHSSASWLGFFECGTQFQQQALLVCGDYIATHPQWRLIYTDEDAISEEGLRQTPQFKPDLNTDFLRSTDYIGSFFVERTAFIKAGGYTHQPDGEKYDIALRLLDSQGDSTIGHIPDVLYHVPVTVTQQASDESAIKSLQAHFDRRLLRAEIHPGLIPGQTRRINYLHATTPKVSIIIPSKNRLELLGPCIESLLAHTRYPDWEILVVDNASDDSNVPNYYQALTKALADRVRILDMPGEFNYAAINNLAANAARGDYLLLLNNDTAALHDDWLDVLMSHAQRPEIGVVGARLLAPDGKELQHAGMILGMNGTAGSVFANTQSPEEPGYMRRGLVEQNYSAVSGACLLVRKSLYLEAGGMDENNFRISNGDVDLCLKIRKLGYRVVWTPHATLIHHGSASLAAADSATKEQRAPILQHEAHQLAKRWLPELADDPAWNRNLSLSSTHPVTEGELVTTWNPDFRDRPRLLWMPLGSPGQAEYRTFAPMRALHENGLAQCTAVCQPKPGYPDRTPTPVELARLAPDTLIMHAPVDNVRCIGLLHYKEINTNILRIYSLDDLITNIPSTSTAYNKMPSAAISERLALGLTASDRLIVSTEPLADLCRDLIEDIRLLPNTLEWKVWGTLQSTRRRGSKLRVGWAGAQQHAGDLKLMLEVVKATHTEVDWIFFGMMPNGAQPYVAEFHEFVHRFADYPAKLASLDLDLAVAPLEIHPFNEAKSNLRLLEYGILGWPVICTDIYPYQTDTPPVTRLANDPGKWIAAIRERISEPGALAREGDALREWVKQRYLLENNLDRWLQALTR